MKPLQGEREPSNARGEFADPCSLDINRERIPGPLTHPLLSNRANRGGNVGSPTLLTPEDFREVDGALPSMGLQRT